MSWKCGAAGLLKRIFLRNFGPGRLAGKFPRVVRRPVEACDVAKGTGLSQGECRTVCVEVFAKCEAKLPPSVVVPVPCEKCAVSTMLI